MPLSWKNTAIGVTRTWPNAQAMAAELAASRVWGGIHFRNSVDTGYRIGKRVAEEVFSTQLRPLPGNRDGQSRNFQRVSGVPPVGGGTSQILETGGSGFCCASARDSDIVGT